MSLIAAFLWRKSSISTICTFIYDDQNINIISRPTIFYLPNNFFKFRKEAKKIISIFVKELKYLADTYDTNILVEYKIVFMIRNIPWIKPSSKSKYVLKFFLKEIHNLQYKSEKILLNPQLREKLHGKELNKFKRELRKMNLVSRKRNAGYEYYLWLVALHATSSTYETKLKKIKDKLLNEFWKKV